jgi:hypothetical protein
VERPPGLPCSGRNGLRATQLGQGPGYETLRGVSPGRDELILSPFSSPRLTVISGNGTRNWLDRLAEAVRKRWEDVTREWPGPWFGRKGALEQGRGVFRLSDGSTREFIGWLWHEPAAEPMALGSWGGWAERATLHRTDEVVLELEGRRPTTVLVTRLHLPSGPLSFFGQEAFPEPG